MGSARPGRRVLPRRARGLPGRIRRAHAGDDQRRTVLAAKTSPIYSLPYAIAEGEFFIVGPNHAVLANQRLLRKVGVSAGRIHQERLTM